MVWGKVNSLTTAATGSTVQLNSATSVSHGSASTSASSSTRSTRTCETPYDKTVESLIAKGIINDELLLTTPPSSSMPPLDKNALVALVNLLTKPMTLTGRPLRNPKTGEVDSKPSFQATFSLVELFQYLEEKGSETTKGLINAINIVGGAVPWILSGASEGKELSTAYLESFFSQLGFKNITKNIPAELLHDFGKRPSDIDIRFMVPNANSGVLDQFREEVNNFITLHGHMGENKKVPLGENKGIPHKHGYSKWNTVIDYQGEEENRRRKANRQNEEPIKKYSVVGFETTSDDLGKHDFDLLFVNQLHSENLFVRDALRIPIKGLLPHLIKASTTADGLTKLLLEINEDKASVKVIPESHYPAGGWQPVIDRLLGICRTKDKFNEFNDWAVLLSSFVRGKRSQAPGLETSLVEQLCKIGAKEKHLFSFAVQNELSQLEDSQQSTFPFLAGFGLKSILANHHNQAGALEALTLQACLSLKQSDDLAKAKTYFAQAPALWKEIHLGIPGKKDSVPKTATTGVFGVIHQAIESEKTLISPVLNLLQVQAFAYLCSGQELNSDAFKATFLMHNKRPHVQLSIDGQHILMPFEPMKAFKELEKEWVNASETGRKHLEAISKEIGYPASFGDKDSSILGRNLGVLEANGFDVKAFVDILENASKSTVSGFVNLVKETFLACQAQIDKSSTSFKYSVQLPQTFAKWLKECSEALPRQTLLEKGRACWNLADSPVSTFEELQADKKHQNVPPQLLWALAQAKRSTTAAAGLAAYECWKTNRTDCLDLGLRQEFETTFVAELGKSRSDLAAKVLGVMVEEGLSGTQIKDSVVRLLKRTPLALNERSATVSSVIATIGALTQSNPAQSAEILTAIPQGDLTNKQEADLLLSLLKKCSTLPLDERKPISPSIHSICLRLSKSTLNKGQFPSAYTVEETFGLLFDEASTRYNDEALTRDNKEEFAALIEEFVALIDVMTRFKWNETNLLQNYFLNLTAKLLDDHRAHIAKTVWSLAFDEDVFSHALSEPYQQLLIKFAKSGCLDEVIDQFLASDKKFKREDASFKKFKREDASFLLELVDSKVYKAFLERDPGKAVDKLRAIIKKVLNFDANLLTALIKDFKSTSEEVPALMMAFLFMETSKPSDALKKLVKVHFGKLLEVLSKAGTLKECQLFLETVNRHFPNEAFNEDAAQAIQKLILEHKEKLSSESVLSIVKFSGCIKKHLPKDYQKVLGQCYQLISGNELTTVTMPIVLDLLIEITPVRADQWNKWLKIAHTPQGNRTYLKKAAEHLLNFSEGRIVEGNSRDVATMFMHAVDAQQKTNNFACLDLLKFLPQLRSYFIDDYELEQCMLDKLFEGVNKALDVEGTVKNWGDKVEAAKRSVNRQTQGVASSSQEMLAIEGGASSSSLAIRESSQPSNPSLGFSFDSKLTLEKLLETNPSQDEVIAALKLLDLKNISTGALKSRGLTDQLKKTPEEALKALKVLYDREQREPKFNLTDAVLCATFEILQTEQSAECGPWLEPIIKRFGSTIGKKSPLGSSLIVLFNRMLNAASALPNDANETFSKLFTYYAELMHEKQSELKLDKVNAQRLLKVAKELKPNLLDTPKEHAAFALAVLKLYQQKVLTGLTTKEQQNLFLHLIELLMGQGLEQDAEELLPTFLELYDKEDPLWKDQEFCGKATVWVEKWLKHGCLADSQAVVNPANTDKLKSIFSFVCRVEDLSSSLYIQTIDKINLCNNDQLAKHIWEEGWKQSCATAAQKNDELSKTYRAARFDSLTSYAVTHYPTGLRRIVEDIAPWSEFIATDSVSHLTRLTSIERLFPFVLTAEIESEEKTPDFLRKWEEIGSKVEAYFTALEHAEELQDAQNADVSMILSALESSKTIFELFRVFGKINFDQEDLMQCDYQALRLWASSDSTFAVYNQMCERVLDYLSMVPNGFQFKFLEVFILSIVPKMKQVAASSEDYPLALDNMLRVYCCLLPTEHEVISFINSLRTGGNVVFEAEAYNLTGVYANHINKGVIRPKAYENQMRIFESVANRYIETLQEEATREIREFHSSLPKDLSQKDLGDAFDRFFDDFIKKSKDPMAIDVRFVDKDPIKQVFYVAYIINILCDAEHTSLRSELIYKTLKSIEILRFKLEQDELANKDIYTIIPPLEVDSLERSFFELILPSDEHRLPIAICREMLTFAKRAFVNEMSPVNEKMTTMVFNEYLAKVAKKLIDVLKHHQNEHTLEEVMECLDAFLFFPFPTASRIESFVHSRELMKAAFDKGVFEKNPLRFFQYTYLCPLQSYNPDHPDQQKLSNEEILQSCEKAITLLLTNTYLSRITEAHRYIEVAGTSGVPPHLEAEGTTSGKIVDVKKKLETMRKRAFQSNPTKYFELWSKIFENYQKLTGEEPIKKQKLGSLFESRIMFLMGCIKSGIFNDKYIENLEYIDQQCKMLKADPKLFFDYAPKITLLYLMKNQDAVLNSEEKAAGLAAFRAWTDYLSESKHPQALGFFEDAQRLLKTSKIFQS